MKITWYLKQLLPLTYWTVYVRGEGKKTQKMVSIWRMWFGKCFNAISFEVQDVHINEWTAEDLGL